MYQNLINSLKKILDSKATQAEKLLKISTLVDFADGLEKPRVWGPPAQYANWEDVGPKPQIPPAQPAQPTQPTVNAKKPTGPGALVGVEDIK